MLKRATLAIAVAATFGLVGPAAAQGFGFGPGYGMMGGFGPGYGMMGGYGRGALVDTNNDGVISAEEAAASADGVFAAMDADDDGSLTLDEYMAVRFGPQYGYNPQREAAMQAAKSARFAAMDTDKDGKVTQQEFIAGAKGHFDAADADKDGKVSPWEFRGRNWN